MAKNNGPVHIRLALWEYGKGEISGANQQIKALEQELKQAQIQEANKPSIELSTRSPVELRNRITELRGFIDGILSVMDELRKGINDDLTDEWDDLQ